MEFAIVQVNMSFIPGEIIQRLCKIRVKGKRFVAFQEFFRREEIGSALMQRNIFIIFYLEELHGMVFCAGLWLTVDCRDKQTIVFIGHVICTFVIGDSKSLHKRERSLQWIKQEPKILERTTGTLCTIIFMHKNISKANYC